MTKEQKLHTARNWCIAILISSGVFMGIAAAGTEDRRDAIKQENRRVGYERYSTEDMASERTTRAMAYSSLLSFAGAAFLLLRDKRQNQK